jgi:hypothetical protein
MPKILLTCPVVVNYCIKIKYKSNNFTNDYFFFFCLLGFRHLLLQEVLIRLKHNPSADDNGQGPWTTKESRSTIRTEQAMNFGKNIDRQL